MALVGAASVSVVIPTLNRPDEVVRAVRSALRQTHPPHEVIIVIDGPDASTTVALEDVSDPRIRVIQLGSNSGAAQARNIGVESSTGDWIAFLDDDDEWLPDRLRLQILAAGDAQVTTKLVLATGLEWRTGSASWHWPLRAPAPGERIADYLFARRHPGEGLLQTSTILIGRDLARRCPLPRHLRVHEDFDWYLELERNGARFMIVMEPLVVYNAPASDKQSLSNTAHWNLSLAWALSRRADMSRRAFSGFCLTEAARSARHGGVRAMIAVFGVAATGSLTWFSVARFLAIFLVSEGARRRLARGLRRVGGNVASIS